MSAVWGSDALSEDDLLKQIEKEIQDININSEPSNNNNFAKPATPTTTSIQIRFRFVDNHHLIFYFRFHFFLKLFLNCLFRLVGHFFLWTTIALRFQFIWIDLI